MYECAFTCRYHRACSPWYDVLHLLSRFTDDTKLGGASHTPESCAALQKDFDRLEGYAEKNCLKFSKGKCRVLHLEKNNPKCTSIGWGSTCWKTALWRRMLVLWWTTGCSWPREGQEGQRYPGMHWEEHCQLVQEPDPAPLLSSGGAYHECCAQFWAPCHKRNMELPEQVQWRAMKVMKGLELSLTRKGRELGLCTQEEMA